MRLEFLLEEQSMEAALLELVPRIRPDAHFELHAYRGKPDLLAKLEGRLRGYSHWECRTCAWSSSSTVTATTAANSRSI